MDNKPTLEDHAMKVARKCWFPLLTESSKLQGGRLEKVATKFLSMKPFFRRGEDWPVCSGCDTRKSLLTQINMRDLPDEMKTYLHRHSGLFRAFYCFRCSVTQFENITEDLEFIEAEEVEDLSLNFFAVSKIVKEKIFSEELPKVLVDEIENCRDDPRWNVKPMGYEAKIVSDRVVSKWKEMKALDLPVSTERETHAALVDENAVRELEKVAGGDDDKLDGCVELRGKFRAGHEGTKLGGYIEWCQNPNYPICPECEVEMTLTFLQLQESFAVPHMWGDSGTAYITVCPRCLKRAGLGWDCY